VSAAVRYSAARRRLAHRHAFTRHPNFPWSETHLVCSICFKLALLACDGTSVSATVDPDARAFAEAWIARMDRGVAS